MIRGEIFRLPAPRAARGEQRGSRYAVIVQADELLDLSAVLVSPTSASARGDVPAGDHHQRPRDTRARRADDRRRSGTARSVGWAAGSGRAARRRRGTAARPRSVAGSRNTSSASLAREPGGMARRARIADVLGAIHDWRCSALTSPSSKIPLCRNFLDPSSNSSFGLILSP